MELPAETLNVTATLGEGILIQLPGASQVSKIRNMIFGCSIEISWYPQIRPPFPCVVKMGIKNSINAFRKMEWNNEEDNFGVDVCDGDGFLGGSRMGS